MFTGMARQMLLALGLVLVSAPTVLAQGPAIEHSGVGCLVAERFPRMDACFAPAADVARGRVHFRAHGTPHWYFVDMKATGPCHEGILPKPQKSTKKVDYYIDVVDRRFAEGRTREHNPIVVEKANECRKDMMMAAGLGSAASIVLGVAAGAPPIPPGFAAEGIAGPPQAIQKSGGGGGGGTVAAFILGAAAAGGAAYYFATKDDEESQGPQYDGEWSGTNSQNREFSFTVAGNAVVRIGTSYQVGTGGTAPVVSFARSLSPPAPITNGTFTYEEQGLVVTGTFGSETAASGRFEPVRTPLTWTATRR